ENARRPTETTCAPRSTPWSSSPTARPRNTTPASRSSKRSKRPPKRPSRVRGVTTARAAAPHLTAVPSTAADDVARAIAVALREGFDRHYALFRDCARAAKHHFEMGNWRAIRHVARDRIDFYDRRVLETVARIQSEFRSAGLDGAGADALGEGPKPHSIGWV